MKKCQKPPQDVWTQVEALIESDNWLEIVRHNAGEVAAGNILIQEVTPQEAVKTDGGIIIPNTAPNIEYTRLRYGVVIACGDYCDHQGRVYISQSGWPLPPATIIEFKNHNPWQTTTMQLVIKSADVTRIFRRQP